MAKLGYRHNTIGSTLYLIITNEANQHMKGLDALFYNYDVDDWEDYVLYLTETDDYLYEYTLPTLADGHYTSEVFEESDSLPYPTDSKLGVLSFDLKDGEFQTATDIVGDLSDLGSW